MKRALVSFILLCAAFATAFGQSSGVPYFPQTLPGQTVVGRLSTNPGATEAIPFSRFTSAAIAAFLPVTAPNGGTGLSTVVVGDILYASSSSPTTWARLADVAVGSVLVSGGTLTAPAWSASPTLTALTATTGTITTATVTTANVTNLAAGTIVAAGTVSVAPVVLTSGTNLTTAAAGAVEFDGKAFYATAAASSRQVLAAEQICVLSAAYTLSNVNTAQQALNCTTNGRVTLAALTTYEFEATFIITNTGTTSHTWSVLFGGGATFTNIGYVARAHTSTGNTLTAVSEIYAVAATAVVVTAASTSATENVVITLRGTMRVNGAGTVIPQVQLSAATGTAASMLTNSFFRLWPIGVNTVAAVGNWD
jgi:hypothetical protein